MSTHITQGIIASPGIRIARAYLHNDGTVLVPKYPIGDHQIEDELTRLDQALEKTKEDIRTIQSQIASKVSKETSDIFSTHLMVLEDPQVIQRARDTIRSEKRNVEWVINDISLELINSLSAIEDEYLRERIIDISDINKRMLKHLQKNSTANSLSDIDEEVIVFASDLTPSETALLDRRYIFGFVTDKGGKTSHTAIMARAMNIPAIVGTMDGSTRVKNGDTVIIDAVHGRIIINPSPQEIEEYQAQQQSFRELEDKLSKLTDLSTETSDGTEAFIYGNIEIPAEKSIIKEHGAVGIGLFRSEFLFLDKKLPDEEQQFKAYREVVEYFSPNDVTIRTLDVGGDKIFTYSEQYQERNPFLGCRAIRFSLEHEDMFRIQLRALLRASHYGSLKIMFPMISTVEEFLRAKEITESVKEELRSQDIPFDEKVPLGIMIEIPSAVISADILAEYVDFFSVGTNDLVQYILAVDRISETIAYLYNPLNPAVLRFLSQIVDVADAHNVPLSICGEIAGEPRYTMLLLGLGFRYFSMSSTYMYQVKNIIRSVSIDECIALKDRVTRHHFIKDIEADVYGTVHERFPELFI